MLLLGLAPAAVGAQEDGEESERPHILSFDLGYLGTGLKHNGLGLGLSYETTVLRYLAVKGGFSHMTMRPAGSGMTVTTVGMEAEALCYPFGRGLEWLYLGAGNGTDFFVYKGDELDGEQKDTLLTLIGEIGWKQHFFGLVMADTFVCYRLPLNDTINSFTDKTTRKGLSYGIRLHLNIPAILARLSRRASAPDSAAPPPAEE